MAESTPGDYYERQRQKAEALQAMINNLKMRQVNTCPCDFHAHQFDEEIRKLERKLEQARYTGD